MTRFLLLAALLLAVAGVIFLAPAPTEAALVEGGMQALFLGSDPKDPSETPPALLPLAGATLQGRGPLGLAVGEVSVSGVAPESQGALDTAVREWAQKAVYQWNSVQDRRLRALPEDAAAEEVAITLDLALSLERRARHEALLYRVKLDGPALQQPLEQAGKEPIGYLPDRLSLLPPLLAIILAIALRRVLPSLFAGVWLGGAILVYQARLPSPWMESGGDLQPGVIGAALKGLARSLDHFLWVVLRDSANIETIGFVVFLCAAVGVMSRSGGMQGLVHVLIKMARGVRSTQLASYFMGLAIFFDDYANCILVGTTVRPLTDRLKIAREKLAFLVDATAAPVAALSVISTWIAFEVSTFSPQLPSVGISDSGYSIFLETLPYRYYALFMLAFIFLNILFQRDFGSMLTAERRARSTGQLVREGGTPMISDRLTKVESKAGIAPLARRALLPILTVLVVTMAMIWMEGGGPVPWSEESWGQSPTFVSAVRGLEMADLRNMLYDGSGARAIMYAAFSGLVVASFQCLGLGGRVGLVVGWLGAAQLTPRVLPAVVEWTRSGLQDKLGSGMARVGLDSIEGGANSLGQFLAADLGEFTAFVQYSTFLALFCLLGVPVGLLFSALFGRDEDPHESQRLTPAEALRAAIASTRALFFAVLILLLAWMIGETCREMGTANYLVAWVGDSIPYWSVPLILFLIACVVAFSTGSSWSTMGILLPIVVGLAYHIGDSAGVPEMSGRLLLVLSIGAVLEGSIFGDHCSPISDTTVLSSVSSASDHIDHVRTQIPYALVVMLVALGAGYVPQALCWCTPAQSFGIGVAVLAAVLLLFGRNPGPALPAAAEGTPIDDDPRPAERVRGRDTVPPWMKE